MTLRSSEDRRLIALAAVFAPGRAEALVSRLADERRDLLRDAAARAMAGTRRDRLGALQDELDRLRGLPGISAAAVATLATERPAVTAAARRALEAATGQPSAPSRPAFRRLLRERTPPVVDRSTAAGPPRAPPGSEEPSAA